MTQTRHRTVEDYMALPYRMTIYWDEDYWAVEFPELQGLVAAADTWEELPAEIARAKEAWFTAMLEDGFPIPECNTNRTSIRTPV